MSEIPWVIEEQTKIKLELLEQYISPWMSILFSNQARYNLPEILLYFDGFSGPGVYFKDDKKQSHCDGSPLIVANVANRYIKEKKDRKVFMFCIDKKLDCANILEDKLQKKNYFKQLWQVYNGSFDDIVNKIVDEIERLRLTDQPMFFFIDPFGYSDYPMSTLRRLLRYPRVELFINFMIYDIVRFFDQSNFKDNFLKLFGMDDVEYSNTFESTNFNYPEKKQAYLLNVYCKKLTEIAKANFVMPFRINTPGRGTRPKYYLIHASKNIKALKVMKDAMAKVSQRPYAFEAIGINTEQRMLFEPPEKIQIVERLQQHLERIYPEGILYQDIEDWAYANTNGISKSIKAALVELEKYEVIEISRKPRQRKNTVTAGAKIVFKNKGNI